MSDFYVFLLFGSTLFSFVATQNIELAPLFMLCSMKNHAKSKKHREMVVLLRQQLEDEDDSFCLNGKEDGEDEIDLQVEEEDEEQPRQK